MRLKTPTLPGLAALASLALVLGWMGFIFYLSQQTAPLGTTSAGSFAVLAHVGIYGTLAALLFAALRSATRGSGPEYLAIVATAAFAIAVLYGVTDELHQAFVPGRTASETDLAVDAAGAILGLGGALGLEAGFHIWRTRS